MKAIVISENQARQFKAHLQTLNKLLQDVMEEDMVQEITMPPPAIATLENPVASVSAAAVSIIEAERAKLRRAVAEKRRIYDAAKYRRQKRAKKLASLWTPERRAAQGRVMRQRHMLKKQMEFPAVNGAALK